MVFYSTNQSQLKEYTKDRRVEQHNGDVQQAKVYQSLAEQRGDINSADRLAKMATLVINKFGQQVQAHTINPNVPITEQPFDLRNYLKKAIQSGTLSQLWEKMKLVPKSKLSHNAKIIQDDIKHNRMLREQLNEKVALYVQHTHNAKLLAGEASKFDKSSLFDVGIQQQNEKALIDEMIQLIEGSTDNESAFIEIVKQAIQSKAEKANAEIAKTIKLKGQSGSSNTEVESTIPEVGMRYSNKVATKMIIKTIENLNSGNTAKRGNGARALESWATGYRDLTKKLIAEHEIKKPTSKVQGILASLAIE
jgi:hypothetical protein